MSVIQNAAENETPSPPAYLSVYLFGVPRVYLDDRPLDIARRPKVLAAFAYLVTEPGSHSRDLLASYLWPDSAPQQAQQNLRQILYRLRKLLDDAEDEPERRSYVVTDRQTVRFDTDRDVWTDVAAFEKLVEHVHRHSHRRPAVCPACVARLEEAVRLYRGPFLDGLGDVGSVSAAFEQWLLLWRESLQQRACQALYTLAEHHLAHEQVEKARTYVRQLLAFDPWNEAAECLSLQATWRLEGRNAALLEYRRFASALSSELGVEPEDETQALAERIKESASEQPTTVGVLPKPVTPFFGRQQELAQLAAYLAQREQRLITLVGVGGSGKTRLALEVAHAQRPDWRDGVWFVPLMQVTTAERLADAIAEVLAPTPSDTRSVSNRLFDFLRHRELLLVLDNFEHLAPQGTALVSEVLRQAPQVKMLITSQVRLNVPEEWVIPLNGLDFPSSAREVPGVEAAQYGAVQLFLHHARRVNPAWSPQADDWLHILRICEQVAGLPLGIELAAAWGRSLLPRQIAAESDAADLDFFHTPPRDETTRHYNLRTTFARAYAMLTEDDQRLFRQLSVFRGGFDLAAAERIAKASVARLAMLLDRSLLKVSAAGRWDWHPLLQRYAAETLALHPAEAHALHQRHSAYYLTFLQTQQGLWWGEEKIGQTIAEIDIEIENVQAAWDWAVAQRDVQALAQSLEKLSLYYYLKGSFRRGEEMCADAVRRLLPPPIEEDETTDEALTALVARLKAEQARFLTRQARYEQAIEKGQKNI